MRKLTLSEVASSLKASANTLIFCHKSPDPDTLGSAFALKYVLEHFGSEVRVACCDRASDKFGFITGGASVTEKFDISSFERVIAIDVGSAKQLGDYLCYADKVTLNIDHHEMNTRFCDYYEDFTPACAMIVYELARELGVTDSLPSHFFECVYAGLSGDTGCFKYSNTTPKALICASELVSRGIDFAEINRVIFDCKSVNEINAQRMTYEHMELYLDGRLAIIAVSNEMKAKYGVSDENMSDIVNTIRSIQGVLVAVSIKETATQGKLSISSRANADIDVANACVKLGGGGHPRAAGATLTDTTLDEARDIVKSLFGEEISNYGK